MTPTKEQISLYKKIREIASPHHLYSDQMMAIAVWISEEFGKDYFNNLKKDEREIKR